MIRQRLIRASCVPVLFALVLAVSFALTGCFGMTQPPQVAAYVNGVVIEEDDVTDFIEGFRNKNAQYETDSEWAEFLKSNGYTSESLRSYVLDTVFIPHAGWNSLPANRDAMSTEYLQVVGELDVDTVSEPVSMDGMWTLIYCDAVFNVGAGGESVVLRTIPKEIYEQIVADATEVKADQLFDEWLDRLASESDVVIEPMPAGLPYNVSSTYVE